MFTATAGRPYEHEHPETSLDGWICGLPFQYRTRNYHSLNLARSLVNCRYAHVAQVALDGILSRVAVSTVHLDGSIANAYGRLG